MNFTIFRILMEEDKKKYSVCNSVKHLSSS
jgi:hypothetical protein